MAKNDGLAKILAIIGGILIIAEAILGMLGRGVTNFVELDFLVGLGAVIYGIIAIVIGLLILISTGVISSKKAKIGFNGLVILVLGILGFLFGSNIGGILVIIAAILMFI
ncbi:hypothetical protein DSAG12_02489 [Promethearchaeum syntrophicum]|uniref:DUF4064 domain-containing protein n=1 Tax=Promethearchaeum syntrophicum TaxID=2594042 RepID=A0A5B9DBM2_9ARCH|nr:hypothetical protein [Candidatus Prometheoarchaeum syntrophicum]QEE16659.1 hypothetical protein DSAG12_02489 [Candidatus Prometheoarchaeum syntrophicum]